MKPQSKKPRLYETLNKLILLKKFAQVDNLAHSIAYDNSISDGETIELLNWNGQTQQAKVTRIPINNPSIVANILEIKTSDSNLPNKIAVIWRGTHDAGSAIADLDPISPGYQEYRKNREIILRYVNDSIAKMTADGKKVSLGSYGHSLGGSLAQVFAVDVIDAVVQNYQDKLSIPQVGDNPDYISSAQNSNNSYYMSSQQAGNDPEYISPEIRANFDRIQDITVGTFNAAGVSKNTAARCKALEDQLQALRFKSKQLPPKIRYFAGLNAGDGVQQTGEASILADSTIAEVYLLKTKVKQSLFSKILIGAISLGGAFLIPKFGPWANRIVMAGQNGAAGAIGTFNSHTAKLFDQQHNLGSKVISFNVYSNKHPEDRAYITQQLNNKSKFLQNPILKYCQAKIYYFADKLFHRNNKAKSQDKSSEQVRVRRKPVVQHMNNTVRERQKHNGIKPDQGNSEKRNRISK